MQDIEMTIKEKRAFLKKVIPTSQAIKNLIGERILSKEVEELLARASENLKKAYTDDLLINYAYDIVTILKSGNEQDENAQENIDDIELDQEKIDNLKRILASSETMAYIKEHNKLSADGESALFAAMHLVKNNLAVSEQSMKKIYSILVNSRLPDDIDFLEKPPTEAEKIRLLVNEFKYARYHANKTKTTPKTLVEKKTDTTASKRHSADSLASKPIDELVGNSDEFDEIIINVKKPDQPEEEAEKPGKRFDKTTAYIAAAAVSIVLILAAVFVLIDEKSNNADALPAKTDTSAAADTPKSTAQGTKNRTSKADSTVPATKTASKQPNPASSKKPQKKDSEKKRAKASLSEERTASIEALQTNPSIMDLDTALQTAANLYSLPDNITSCPRGYTLLTVKQIDFEERNCYKGKKHFLVEKRWIENDTLSILQKRAAGTKKEKEMTKTYSLYQEHK